MSDQQDPSRGQRWKKMMRSLLQTGRRGIIPAAQLLAAAATIYRNLKDG